MQTDDEKASIRQLESGHEIGTKGEYDGADRHLAVEMPASLVGLTDEEREAVDRAATRKLDILLMPTLVALYIL
jgi:hypothetical protein